MKKKLLYKETIFITKLINDIHEILSLKKGYRLFGEVARKISPDILSYLIKQTKKEIILTTGTSGKTITNFIIENILKCHDRKTAYDENATNMIGELTNTLINYADRDNEIFDIDNCVIELKENSLSSAFKEFVPDILLITNLLKNHNNSDYDIEQTLKDLYYVLKEIQQTKLILNADDPFVSALSSLNNINKVYFGFEQIKYNNSALKNYSNWDNFLCKICGNKLQYKNINYAHIGNYSCTCNNNRPNLDIKASAQVNITGSSITVKSSKTGEFTINYKIPGVYNLYNVLAAISVCIEMDIPVNTIIKGVETYNPVYRSATVYLDGKPVLINLIKDSIGTNEVLRTVKADKNAKLLFVFNDEEIDDSWLWDVDIEKIVPYEKNIIISGKDASDIALRLKYAGINSKYLNIINNPSHAIDKALFDLSINEKLYVFSNYSAVSQLQHIFNDTLY